MRFPVIKQAPGEFYSWNLPRLFPDVLPKLNLSMNADLSWSKTNVSTSFSSRERSLHEEHMNAITTGDILADLKENVFSLLLNSAGLGPMSNGKAGPRTFFLDMEGEGVMTIIFFVGIRLDINDATVAADSYVLPLVPELVGIFGSELYTLSEKGGVSLKCTKPAYKLWTSFIKASVERSRIWSREVKG